MTEPTTEPPKMPAKSPARATAATDPAQLRALIARIDAEADAPHLRAALIAELEASAGLSLAFTSGTYRARMAGITATNTEGERGALKNWANAARRRLLAVGSEG